MLINAEFSKHILKNPQISNFKKPPVIGSESFHATDRRMEGRTDGWMDGRRDKWADRQTQDEANSRFSQFCEGT